MGVACPPAGAVVHLRVGGRVERGWAGPWRAGSIFDDSYTLSKPQGKITSVFDGLVPGFAPGCSRDLRRSVLLPWFWNIEPPLGRHETSSFIEPAQGNSTSRRDPATLPHRVSSRPLKETRLRVPSSETPNVTRSSVAHFH